MIAVFEETVAGIALELATAETELSRAEAEAADAERDLAAARLVPAAIEAVIAGLPDPRGRLGDRMRRSSPDLRSLANRAAQAREVLANARHRVAVLRSESAELAKAVELRNAPVPGSEDAAEAEYAAAYGAVT